MPRIFAVICARNEQAYLPVVIGSLDKQTMPPNRIIVVDDGSTDATHSTAIHCGAEVISLPYHESSHVGTPEMAKKFNAGFKQIPEDADYTMIAGADDEFYQEDYIERIVGRMQEDPALVMASGQADGDPIDTTNPRGSGRIIKASYFRKTMHSQYPESYAAEDYPIYKALSMGLQTMAFPDIKFHRHRQSRRSWSKSFRDGRSMYVLGHRLLYVIARSAYLSIRSSPKNGFALFCGYLTAPFKAIEQLDTKDWVHETDTKRLKNKARRVFGLVWYRG